MSLLGYLSDFFLTEAQLLAASGIDALQLQALQERRVMPQASYTLRLAIHCASYFGPHDEHETLRYYAKGYVGWIADAGKMDADAAFDLFSQRYLARLQALDAVHVQPDLPAEWQHFLQGTYGLCTKSGLPEDIAAKELAVCTIKALLEVKLDAAQTERLRQMVDLLDAASSPFAPHELARSSRQRLVNQVREQFL